MDTLLSVKMDWLFFSHSSHGFFYVKEIRIGLFGIDLK